MNQQALQITATSYSDQAPATLRRSQESPGLPMNELGHVSPVTPWSQIDFLPYHLVVLVPLYVLSEEKDVPMGSVWTITA